MKSFLLTALLAVFAWSAADAQVRYDRYPDARNNRSYDTRWDAGRPGDPRYNARWADPRARRYASRQRAYRRGFQQGVATSRRRSCAAPRNRYGWNNQHPQRYYRYRR